MDEIIYQALRERKIIQFTYQGSTMKVCPYFYGQTNAGDDVLVGVDNDSTSSDWMMFVIDEISNLSLTEETFEPVVFDASNLPLEKTYAQMR
jgi:hypothetical protein